MRNLTSTPPILIILLAYTDHRVDVLRIPFGLCSCFASDVPVIPISFGVTVSSVFSTSFIYNTTRHPPPLLTPSKLLPCGPAWVFSELLCQIYTVLPSCFISSYLQPSTRVSCRPFAVMLLGSPLVFRRERWHDRKTKRCSPAFAFSNIYQALTDRNKRSVAVECDCEMNDRKIEG